MQTTYKFKKAIQTFEEVEITAKEAYSLFHDPNPDVDEILQEISDLGYKVVDFRPPRLGETFLTNIRTVDTADFDWPETKPRFIIVRDFKYTHTYTPEEIYENLGMPPMEEVVDFRPPKRGEYFWIGSVTGWARASWDWNPGAPRFIKKG